LPQDTWLVRNLIGYGVLRYEDAVGILRDKRWHSASARIPELMGITRADFLARQRGSILSTEGDEHVRLVIQVQAVADQLVVFDFDGAFGAAHVGTAIAASATLFATAPIIAATIIAGTPRARLLAAAVVAFVRIRFALAAALRLGRDG
jgi:hypothetical protein